MEIDTKNCMWNKESNMGVCLLRCEESDCDFIKLNKTINRYKWYLEEIRLQELRNLDVDYDEYESNCGNTEYSNIINLVEEALGERSPEDCRYDG